MMERRGIFLFSLCLNLIIVAPREIGDFRKNISDTLLTENSDSDKKSLESITEDATSSDLPPGTETTIVSIEKEGVTNDDFSFTTETLTVKEEDVTSDDLIVTTLGTVSETTDNDEQSSKIVNNSETNFKANRSNLLQMEEDMAFGSDVILGDEEKKVNDTLMEAKFKEIEIGFANEGKFLPKYNFLRVKDEIEKSKVFKMIKKMPKGCLLHAHDVGTVSQEYVLRNVTYRPNLYACESDGKLKLRFFEIPDTNCNWKLLSQLRATPESEKEINQRIRQHMSMMTENPEEAYPDGDKAWIKFQSLFEFLGSFMRYRPVYEDYYYQLLKENYEDKFLYVELRASFSALYELNGKTHGPIEVAKFVKDVGDRFLKEHPDFIGVKIIYSQQRHITVEKLKKHLKNFQQLKDTYPNFIVGFDLVGQENKGYPLKNFTKQLLELKSEYQKFIFHAGETDWNGLSTDENLIDAVLLRTKRIGHGFALPKHPKVMELVKKQDIAIEKIILSLCLRTILVFGVHTV
ncbi:adenosine deaminase 2-like isoform X2 [Leptopilina heterotoma]|uniref:adenosine deaminase 2-like isoform X2 n=1 Tax=Leptopilina heterotoma TaxID=63436 RepID=UPI001CA9632B|nr:adenosine deaminase 2-like isoform X2 [Leptopilina heterotoma]